MNGGVEANQRELTYADVQNAVMELRECINEMRRVASKVEEQVTGSTLARDKPLLDPSVERERPIRGILAGLKYEVDGMTTTAHSTLGTLQRVGHLLDDPTDAPRPS